MAESPPTPKDSAPAGRPGSISIPRRLYRRLVRIALEEEPREACALLVGAPAADGAGAVRVTGALPAANAASDPETEFSIPNEDLIKAYKAAEDDGLAIVGIFHSHPSSGAAPSETDMRMMRSNAVAWVIYSGRDCEARAYVAGGGGGADDAVEVPIRSG